MPWTQSWSEAHHRQSVGVVYRVKVTGVRWMVKLNEQRRELGDIWRSTWSETEWRMNGLQSHTRALLVTVERETGNSRAGRPTWPTVCYKLDREHHREITAGNASHLNAAFSRSLEFCRISFVTLDINHVLFFSLETFKAVFTVLMLITYRIFLLSIFEKI